MTGTPLGSVAYIAIGNSDDRLSQIDWARFVADVHQAVTKCAAESGGRIHYATTSSSASPYQTAAWCVQLPFDARPTERLRIELCDLAAKYRQDAISWAKAVPEMLRPQPPL